MCPAHAAWPPRPCARSPSRDVRRPSNLPSHLSPLSHYQPGSIPQARLPRLAHITNLDRAVWRRICPAPSHTCSLVSELVSSVHPAALLPLHRHVNAVRQASSHFWAVSTPCPCSHAPVCCAGARAARYLRGRDTRLTAPCRQRAAMPLAPGHLCPSRLPSPWPFALPHAHECATAALASLL
jgi:hypothetical protein